MSDSVVRKLPVTIEGLDERVTKLETGFHQIEGRLERVIDGRMLDIQRQIGELQINTTARLERMQGKIDEIHAWMQRPTASAMQAPPRALVKRRVSKKRK